MAFVKRIKMSGDEFAKKIMQGERDFKLINLQGYGFNKYEGIQELQKYLEQQYLSGNLQKNPINITDSDFRYVKAVGLILPYTVAVEACFERAHLTGIMLEKSNLSGSYLENACFINADLRGANLHKVFLYKATLNEADIRGVENLKDTIGLEYMFFQKLIVTKKERKIIEAARKKLQLYDVRNE